MDEIRVRVALAYATMMISTQGEFDGDRLALMECPVIMDEGYGPPSGTRPSGKVRDTAKSPKPRKRERRSPRHTQRRR